MVLVACKRDDKGHSSSDVENRVFLGGTLSSRKIWADNFAFLLWLSNRTYPLDAILVSIVFLAVSLARY